MPLMRGRTLPRTAALLAGLGAIVVWFLLSRSHYFTRFTEASFDPYYWPRRWALLPHVAAGGTAISTGLVQLWLGLTGRTGPLHKALGRIYVGAIAGRAGGPLPRGEHPRAARRQGRSVGLHLAWVVTTSMPTLAIKRRDTPSTARGRRAAIP